jgi:hypothetical protein
MPDFLFEFHFRDGRISEPIRYEWDDQSVPLDEGVTVLLEFEGVKAWKVAHTAPAAGYAAMVVLEEAGD